MNGTKKSANYKIQKKILKIQKGLLSRGATGWMLNFNVRNTFAFSTTCTKGHLVEKAIGVTRHIEMKHPACCTAAPKSFLNLQDLL